MRCDQSIKHCERKNLKILWAALNEDFSKLLGKTRISEYHSILRLNRKFIILLFIKKKSNIEVLFEIQFPFNVLHIGGATCAVFDECLANPSLPL